MRRVSIAAVAVGLMVLSVPTAAADVEYDDSVLEAFGLEGDGDEFNQEFMDAWGLFVNSSKGARIIDKIDADENWEVTIVFFPGDEFKDGEEVWAISRLFKVGTDDGQERVEITIRSNDTGGVNNLADTIYHEFRHVENWVDEDTDENHDRLHAGTDPGMNLFLSQINPPEVETSEAETSIPGSETPIYDSITAGQDDRLLRYTALDLGNILAGGSGTEPTETPPVLELDEAVFVNGIDLELAELLVDLTDNSLATDSGGKCVSGDDSVSCGSQAGFSAQEGDLLIGLRASEMIPLEGFDQSYVFMALFDSDGDSSNNRVGIGELDPYHGTDLWYLMDFDLDFGWNFRTWRVGEGGSIDIDPTSNAFGLIQNDMAWLIIPSSELPQVEPWAQVAIARYDDNYLTGLTGIDPLGELVTDPMVGLDGSRVGGHVTGSAGTSSSTVLSYTPTMVPYGGILDVEFCLFGSDGNPWAGQDVAATLGDPPSSTTATHASGTTGGDGCVRMPLEVNEPEGESTLHVFDGTSVMAVSPITVVEPTGSEAVYLEDFDEDEAIRLNDLLVIMSALFVDVETSGTRGNGDLHTVEDPLADQDNPFFSNPVDQKDDTLPLVWDVVGFNLFSVDPGTTSSTDGMARTRWSTSNPRAATTRRRPLGTSQSRPSGWQARWTHRTMSSIPATGVLCRSSAAIRIFAPRWALQLAMKMIQGEIQMSNGRCG